MITKEDLTWLSDNIRYNVNRLYELQKRVERKIIAIDMDKVLGGEDNQDTYFGIKDPKVLEAIDQIASGSEEEIQKAKSKHGEYLYGLHFFGEGEGQKANLSALMLSIGWNILDILNVLAEIFTQGKGKDCKTTYNRLALLDKAVQDILNDSENLYVLAPASVPIMGNVPSADKLKTIL